MAKSDNSLSTDKAKKSAVTKQTVIRLLLLIFSTAIIFGFYRYALNTGFFLVVMIVYLVALTALLLGYLIYNRGMMAKKVTYETLPDDWSEEKKTKFIEDTQRRKQRSSWMVIPIFAFVFTFAFDLFELFLLPFIENMLPQ